MRRTLLPMCVSLLVLTGCEGTHNLSKRPCLPLAVPARVALLVDASLYVFGDDPTQHLIARPAAIVDNGINQPRKINLLPAGTTLHIERLQQRWGFDSGLGRITAVGTTAAGDRFEYTWDVDTSIERAPWERSTVASKRTVHCEQ